MIFLKILGIWLAASIICTPLFGFPLRRARRAQTDSLRDRAPQ
jgi:hypothetical protein